ncbi:DedA family protein [Nitrogeniibacter aestuarii]|uniref:DedA family protein n=1 Tax=Nitrogeniibacter aestuarii TaxID=2815343 RepID=UPI001D12A7A1|nr:DedA family protein [Nitrogeniibacter aestuarii]
MTPPHLPTLQHLLDAGLPVVTAVVALEAIGAPLPGESLIIALGAALGHAHQSIVPAFFALWLGAVIGDSLGYAIGRRLGRHALLKHGGRIGLTEARLARAEALFARWGVGVVVVARFFVFLRQLNGVLAGSLGLPWWRFLAANMVGGALWVGVWLTLSDKVSGALVEVLKHLPGLKLVVLGAVVIGLAAVFVVRRRQSGRPHRGH